MLKNINTNLVKDNDYLLLAVSGGIDSMVMLHNMNELKSKMNIKIAVAYMDHQKRDDSNLDYDLVTSTCKELNIECYTEKLVDNDNENFHDYAHKERYNFFVRVANKINANKVVLAHNLNDNAETVLMRMTRGSSFEGYRGILPVSLYNETIIIRPILSVSRDEIVAYQQKHNIKFNEDSSNSENTYTRNRFRHDLLPLLEKENPKFLEKFKQFSDYQSMSYELINNLSEMYLKKNLVEKANDFYLNIPSVISLDRILLIEVIKKTINKKTNNTLELSYQNITDIINLIENKKPHISINIDDNLCVYKSYDNLIFATTLKEFKNYEFVINECQEVLLPDNSLVIITNTPNKYYGIMYKLCYNNLDLIFPLSIRNRRNGDKVLTEAGSKKVKDMLINKKIPMETRNKLPIVLGNDQKILWIPNIFKAKTIGNEELYIIYQEGKTNA